MNTQRSFDALQSERLGKYIYALRDPRDGKIFYIGQGICNRLFDHFNEADQLNAANINIQTTSSKILRILDIWKNEEDVEWLILAHDLSVENGNEMANYLESAIYDCLSESQNGQTLNEIIPPKSSSLLPEDIVALGADFINPAFAIENVYIFSIYNALNTGATPYNATRSAWSISQNNRNLHPSYGVGLKNSISIGSFEINNWNIAAVDQNRYEFTSPGHPNAQNYLPLLNKNWTNILSKVRGFWLRGGHIIVGFNGQGQFRIIRGSVDKNTWHNCV
jgi:hypothetical protein